MTDFQNMAHELNAAMEQYNNAHRAYVRSKQYEFDYTTVNCDDFRALERAKELFDLNSGAEFSSKYGQKFKENLDRIRAKYEPTLDQEASE